MQNGNESELIEKQGDKFMLKEGVTIQLYITETPCGDCSMILRQD